MITVFWGSQGVIYIDYLEKGKTVRGLYYDELLGRIAGCRSPVCQQKSREWDSGAARTSLL